MLCQLLHDEQDMHINKNTQQWVRWRTQVPGSTTSQHLCFLQPEQPQRPQGSLWQASSLKDMNWCLMAAEKRRVYAEKSRAKQSSIAWKRQKQVHTAVAFLCWRRRRRQGGSFFSRLMSQRGWKCWGTGLCSAEHVRRSLN